MLHGTLDPHPAYMAELFYGEVWEEVGEKSHTESLALQLGDPNEQLNQGHQIYLNQPWGSLDITELLSAQSINTHSSSPVRTL